MERKRLAVLFCVMILLDFCHQGHAHMSTTPTQLNQQNHEEGRGYEPKTPVNQENSLRDAALHTIINSGTYVQKDAINMTAVHQGIHVQNDTRNVRKGIRVQSDVVNTTVQEPGDMENDTISEIIEGHEINSVQLVPSARDNESFIIQQNLTKPDLDSYNDPAVLFDYIQAKLVQLNISTGVSEFDCGNVDTGFHRHIMGVPLAEEMYGLVSVCMLILQGCKNESWTRFLELADLFEDPEMLLDMLILLGQGMEDTVRSDLRFARPVSNETVLKVEGSIQNMTAQVRVLESKEIVEEELGVLKCNWEKITDNPYPVCSKQLYSRSQSHTGYLQPTDALLRAKLVCERHHINCLGVYPEQNSTSYNYIYPCNASSSSVVQDQGTALWMKGDCFENKTTVVSNNYSTSHLHRRDTSDEVSLMVYEHWHFRGRHQSFQGAVEYVGDQLNDKVSSMKCDQDCSVIAFEHRDFQGRQQAFTGMVGYVGDVTNDIISSIIVLPFPITQLCFHVYEHHYFGGQTRKFCGDQDFSSTAWDKKISSIKLECEDCSVILYDRSYAGKFKSLRKDVPFVGDDWNDVATSIQIRPWKYENYEGQLQPETWLYEHRNFHGRSKAIIGSDNYVGNTFNDKVSSIRCNGECSIIVFEHSEFKGDTRLYSGSQTILPDFNDKLSSLLVLTHSICVIFYEHSRYRGNSVRYCNDVSNVQSRWNDAFSSMKVECDFCSVIVYEHSVYGGRYKAFRGHISYVGRAWNDVITSVKIRPWKLDNYESTAPSCVDAGEQKAYNVIQWIPFLSFFYNLATSIYYGAVGCHSVAQQRAIDMAVGVAMDVAMVVTAGTIAPAALGARTAAKLGVKAGMKAFMKAGVSTAKNTFRNGVKQGVKIAKNGFKPNINKLGSKSTETVKDIGHIVKSVPSSIKSGISSVGRGVQQIGRNGIKTTARKVGRKTKTIAKKKFHDLADSAQKQIDLNGNAKSLGGAQSSSEVGESWIHMLLLCRVRRTPTGKSKCKSGREKLIDAQDRAISVPRSEAARTMFDNINNLPTRQLTFHNTGGTSTIDSILYRVSDESETLDVLHKLQHYNDYMRGQGQLVKPNGNVVESKYALEVNMQIGGEPFEFALMPGRGRQTFVHFSNKIDDTVSHSYDGIIKQLDKDANVRMKAAEAISDALDRGKTTSSVIDWGSLDAKQKEAAKELIVLTHVAEPAVPLRTQVDDVLSMMGNKKAMQVVRPNSIEGGVGGIDKMARQYITKIKNDPENWTFHKAFNTQDGRFVIARVGGKKKIKQNIYKPDNTRQQREFDSDAMDMSESSQERKRRSVGS